MEMAFLVVFFKIIKILRAGGCVSP